MSILSSLVRLSTRRDDIAPFGYSPWNISFVIDITTDGAPVGVRDIRQLVGKRFRPRELIVPVHEGAARTSATRPNFLWDKSTYVLGIAPEIPPNAKDDERKALEREARLAPGHHRAFVEFHNNVLRECNDDGLLAVRRFLNAWHPERFKELGWPSEMHGAFIVFSLDQPHSEQEFIHERPAARQLWNAMIDRDTDDVAICLVTGKRSPIARTHPTVKGVKGTPSGGAIVSFNKNAFNSHGWEQGENAPISKSAAFAYTTVLNRLLSESGHNKITVGNMTTVFWVEADTRVSEVEAEDALYSSLAYIDKDGEEAKHSDLFKRITRLEDIQQFAPNLDGAAFYMLGLSGKLGRISIRFWIEDSYGSIVRNYQSFLAEMQLHSHYPKRSLNLEQYLKHLAALEDLDRLSPRLPGEWMKSIINGSRYPTTLFSTALMRIRVDGNVSRERASIVKASLIRNFAVEVPVALDTTIINKGYLLGRLFAVYEYIQSSASTVKIKSTIKDKYFASATTQPQRVFGTLAKIASVHLSKLRKRAVGRAYSIDKQVESIVSLMSLETDPFPKSLSGKDQGMFIVGYYQQREALFTPKAVASTVDTEE